VTLLPLLLAVQDAASPPPPPAMVPADTAWMLVSTALVLLMTPALAFFYGGLVRNKNSLNTMMMSFVALGVVGVTWALAAYSLAFSEGGPLLGGLANLGLAGVGTDVKGTIPHVLFMAYQGTFAIITAALISGAIVERMRFRAYIAFLVLWATLVYVPLAHWVWGAGGWLQKLGALDFAGGTVVHISAGVSAFVAARMLGPRQGFRRTPLVPHNVPLVLLGAGLLWFGWFGFNAGSALAANGIAVLAFVNTNTAAAAALVMWAALDALRGGKVTAVGAATGAVVGLVGITPAAGYVTPRAAIVIGAACAMLSYFAIQRRSKSGLDDSLDVFSCHGLAGIGGALLTGVFANKFANPGAADGLLHGNPGQLGIQALAVAAAIGIAGVGTFVIFTVVRAVFGVRPLVRDEILGLDVTEHGEEAYPGGGLAGPGTSIGESVVLSAPPPRVAVR
jgi:ammonium transporter, Amt family